MNEIQIFNNEEFGRIRTIVINGETWFVCKDVCQALNLKNPSSVVKKLFDNERTKLELGRQGATWFINESGLYAVILRSDKKEATRFRQWVTSEVLPTIRKTGGYGQQKCIDCKIFGKRVDKSLLM